MKVRLFILNKDSRLSKTWMLSLIGIFLVTFFIVSNLLAKSKAQQEIFFNGQDLKGWSSSDLNFWKVKEGAIIGHSDSEVKENQFIWSDVEVKDFYLSVDVLLTPDDRNAGIQFRSVKIGNGQAKGYQADIGQGVWGKLYHEHGRKILDWPDAGEKAAKKEQWNHYEILAVGHRIWAAVNGTLSIAVEDPEGELFGYIAFQIHSGQPQTVKYKINTLIHNPKIELAGMNESQLKNKLRPVLKSQSREGSKN